MVVNGEALLGPKDHEGFAADLLCVVSASVRRLGVPAAICDDLTQDTMLVVCRKLHVLAIMDAPAVMMWIQATVGFVYKNHLRTDRRRGGATQPIQEEDFCRAGCCSQTEEITDGALITALGLLSSIDRILVIGYAVEGQSTAELALASGITQVNVRKRISRAKAELRKCLALNRTID
jgi:DNA-directed RNA polymerase specialized sigma24 family protein